MIHSFKLLSNRLTSNLSKSAVHAAHCEQWHRKSLRGQWPKLMDSLKADSYKWLQSAYLKPVTEALITATQEKALHTRWFGCHILGSTDNDLCRR